MIVLGIDPGIANTGWGVVSGGPRPVAIAHGTITTSPRTAPELRLAQIHATISTVLDEHEITSVALEDLYFGKNTSSAIAVGQARGVSLVLAGLRGLECFSYTPQHIKQAVCGRGSAQKAQVQRMIGALLRVEPATDHAADALAVALCHVQRAPLALALKAAIR
ncbi:MAG: crossover junction endodeoxyribonuclease RuvC [Solirubrobacteraceae bacterium]|nr:crossover junction endodeoxyribonuclease RuvC [Solirubrobacteraceae bacterium]